MKYRSALAIHFKPGKSRVAIPLLSDLWNGATIIRRIGKEAALIGMYKDFETLFEALEEMKLVSGAFNAEYGNEIFYCWIKNISIKKKTFDVYTLNKKHLTCQISDRNWKYIYRKTRISSKEDFSDCTRKLASIKW
mgnify:CR=1 FL=1